MYVKGANLGFCLKEVPHRIVDLLVLFALIFLGILSPGGVKGNLPRARRRKGYSY